MYYIYEIKNLINEKTYVGQRLCPKDITPLEDKYMGSGELIKKAIKKYGLENFTKTILEEGIETKKEVDKREIYWIAKYKEEGKGEYNFSRGGTGGNLGEEVIEKQRLTKIKMFENNPELREKVSITMREVLSDQIIKEKMSKSHKEAMNRPEVKEKCRKSHLGNEITEEHRKKISEALKGKNTWSKGKKLSEETKEKIRKTLKGRVFSEEHRKKISEACKNKNRNTKWYNDGIKSVQAYECPEGYVEGFLHNCKAWNKGYHWYNNGKINVMSKECPKGFVKGQLIFNKCKSQESTQQ